MGLPLEHELEIALPPHQLVSALAARGTCALDSDGGRPSWGAAASGPGYGASTLLAEPEVVFQGGASALRDALRWLDPRRDGLPDRARLVGYLGYELGEAFEPLRRSAAGAPVGSRVDSSLPSIWLAGFRAWYHYCPRRDRGWVRGSCQRAVAQLRERLDRASREPHRGAGPGAEALTECRSPEGRAQFVRGVDSILGWIRAGDVYQVNLSHRLRRGGARGAAPRLYAQLAEPSPAPFAAYLHTGSAEVISASPERFLFVRGRDVETCPIKGTRPRGRTPEEDGLQAKRLQASAKDAAEHLMIVDLERNDLGRVCELGSVRVDALARLRSYPTVHHLVSTVRGRLVETWDVEQLLAATFPGGSITGAPKLRAREIIAELEPEPRGVYTGAIGQIDAAGGMDLSIAIRTAVVRGDVLELSVGGGIVADSNPGAELRETLDKAEAFARLWRGEP